ncbi:hypothetical protein [Xenorhabdus lircayensis]|uniref:hypothetical protein n=1 Tax=Xenorhabdus lircayensis TaxID=2763499 RepID=UPI001E566C43|nr:hypothetical protein [Xenorhabdus lircayensis]
MRDFFFQYQTIKNPFLLLRVISANPTRQCALWDFSTTGERRPVYRTAGGRSAGAGGREPASDAPVHRGLRHAPFCCQRRTQLGSPLRGLHGAEMGEHGNEQGACDCEPRAASAAGLGRGRSINGGRRPTCLQGCWPDVAGQGS